MVSRALLSAVAAILLVAPLHATRVPTPTTPPPTPTPTKTTGPPTPTPTRQCPMFTCTHVLPMCGSDNVTYAADCYLSYAQCMKPGLTKQYDGACGKPVPTTCANPDPVCGSTHETFANECVLNYAKAYYSGLKILYYGTCEHSLYPWTPAPTTPPPTATTPPPTPTPTPSPSPRCPVVTCMGSIEVCGSDGQTYMNECYLNAAKCEKPTLTKQYDGECGHPLNCTGDVQVCGSNHETFPNECALEYVRLHRPDITKLYDGDCDHPIATTAPPTTTPVPTPECPVVTCMGLIKVCGSDNVTYMNECYLNATKCEKPTLTKLYDGECGHPLTTPPPTTPAVNAPCGNDQTGPTVCQSGQYCQPWNPTYYQCHSVPDKCGKQEVGVDYYGDDLKAVQVVLPEQCCDECFKTQGCTAYTFVNYNSDGKAYCYLKKGTGESKKKVGAVSAQIQAPACQAKEWDACGNPAIGAQCCPDGDYCQPWDVNFFQCVPRAAKCTNFQPQVDFFGDDLKTMYSVGPWECCEQCSKTPGCKAYTFVNDNKDVPACYLKSGTGTKKYHATAVSAEVL